MKKYKDSARIRSRRRSAVDLLTKQLAAGTKNTKEGKVPLSEKDVARIERELETLNNRL